jgi:hypothetical protein
MLGQVGGHACYLPATFWLALQVRLQRSPVVEYAGQSQDSSEQGHINVISLQRRFTWGLYMVVLLLLLVAAGDNKEDLHRNGSVVPKTAVNVGSWLEAARERTVCD